MGFPRLLAPGRWRWLALAALLGGAGAVYFLRDPGNVASPELNPHEQSVQPEAPLVLTETDHLRHDLLASLAAAPGQPFPAALPWLPQYEIGSRGAVPLTYLLHQQPLTFLEMCLERYEREVQNYRLTFLKRERVQGKLQPPEKLTVHYRDKPFSVHMHWLEGGRLAQKVLYVEGENQNQMLVRPAGRLLSAFVVSRAADGPDARQSGRYTIREFGLHHAMQSAVDHMHAAQRKGTLHLRYDGVVTLAEVGGRPCYKFVRTPYDPPEEDGINELTLYIDRDSWLQVGSVLKDRQGNLLGEYFFRDIEINPPVPAAQFQRGTV